MWQCFHSYAWQVVGSDRQAVDYSSVKRDQLHTASIILCSLFDFCKTVGWFWFVASQLLHYYNSFLPQSSVDVYHNCWFVRSLSHRAGGSLVLSAKLLCLFPVNMFMWKSSRSSGTFQRWFRCLRLRRPVFQFWAPKSALQNQYIPQQMIIWSHTRDKLYISRDFQTM